MGLEMASEYVRAQGYSPDTTEVMVSSGAEPPTFTCHFLGWDASNAKAFVDPYEAKLAAALAANPKGEEAPPTMLRGRVGSQELLDLTFVATPREGGGSSFTYDELTKAVGELPVGVDPRKREEYLSDADFAAVMGSPRGEFVQMKAWKQQQIKKAKGLF